MTLIAVIFRGRLGRAAEKLTGIIAPPSRAGYDGARTNVSQSDLAARQLLPSLIEYAVMAPSAHNIQPWRFHLRGNTLELYAERPRALPVVDPNGRELTIACGAALFNLLVALHHHGWGSLVQLLPPGRDLLARVALTVPVNTSPDEHRLFACIPSRRTWALPFLDEPVEAAVLGELKKAAAAEGARLLLVDETVRESLIETIEQADRQLEADPAFRREMAEWMRSNFSQDLTGVPGYSRCIGGFFSLLAPVLERSFNLGEGHAEGDRELARTAPILAVLETPGDQPRDWLVAGQAIQHVLLAGVAQGLQASFLNQPLQVPSLRRGLRELLGLEGQAQMIVRMGYPPPEPWPTRAPRLAVGDVLDGRNARSSPRETSAEPCFNHLATSPAQLGDRMKPS